MNAYDLAEGILAIEERIFLTSKEHKLFQNSANMLRQQADELEAFKLSFYNTGYTLQLRDKDETIRQQADRIAELEKEKENYKYDPDTGEPLIDGYPLFSGLPTPQTKPLSNERLQEIYKKVYEEGHDNQVVALCRAIEKEHGIL